MDPGSTPRAAGPGGLSGVRGLDGLGGLGYGAVDAKGKGRLGRDEDIVLGGDMRRESAASSASAMTAEIGGRQSEGLEGAPPGSDLGQVTPILNTGQEDEEGKNEDTEDIEDGPDVEALRGMRTRLEEMDLQRTGDTDGWSQRDELAGMVRRHPTSGG